MSTDITPDGGGQDGGQEPQSLDYSGWEKAGVVDPNGDPWEARRQLELGRAILSPDQRGMALQQVLSQGDQPILPPGMSLHDAADVLRMYHEQAQGGQQAAQEPLGYGPPAGYQPQYAPQGFQQPPPGPQYGQGQPWDDGQGGYVDEYGNPVGPQGYQQPYQAPAFDPGQLLSAVDQRMQGYAAQLEQRMMAAQQKAMADADFNRHLGQAEQQFPEAVRGMLRQQAEQLRAGSAYITPEAAVQQAAAGLQQSLDAYAASLTQGRAPVGGVPPRFSPSGGSGPAEGGAPPQAPKSIREAAQMQVERARSAGLRGL